MARVELRKVNTMGIGEVVGTTINDTVVAIGGMWRTKRGENHYDLIREDGSHIYGPFTYREEKIYAQKIVIQKTICCDGYQESDMTFAKSNNENRLAKNKFEFRKEVTPNSNLGKKLLNLHKAYDYNCLCNCKKNDKYYYKTQIIAINDKNERFDIYSVFTPCNDKSKEYINKKYGYREK